MNEPEVAKHTPTQLKHMIREDMKKELERILEVPFIKAPEEPLQLRVTQDLLYFASKKGKIMEDSIELHTIEEAREKFREEETTGNSGRWNALLDLVLNWKSGVINVEIWNKSVTELTSGQIGYVRKVVDMIAKKYDLAKIYQWGRDNGGTVMFYNNYAVQNVYYGRGGSIFDAMDSPRTEDEFWEMAKQQLTM